MKIWHFLVLAGAFAALWKFGVLSAMLEKIDAMKAATRRQREGKK